MLLSEESTSKCGRSPSTWHSFWRPVRACRDLLRIRLGLVLGLKIGKMLLFYLMCKEKKVGSTYRMSLLYFVISRASRSSPVPNNTFHTCSVMLKFHHGGFILTLSGCRVRIPWGW